MRFAVYSPIEGMGVTWDDFDIVYGKRSKKIHKVGPTICSKDNYIDDELDRLVEENENFESFQKAYYQFLEETEKELEENNGVISFPNDCGWYIVNENTLSLKSVAKALKKYMKDRGKKGKVEIVLLDLDDNKPQVLYKNGHVRQLKNTDGTYVFSHGSTLFSYESRMLKEENGEEYEPTQEELLKKYFENRTDFNRRMKIRHEFMDIVLTDVEEDFSDGWFDMRFNQKFNGKRYSDEEMEELLPKLKSGEVKKEDILGK